MKRIILTESQYKRLVRQNLNEQRVVYEDPKDEKDINYDMFSILDSVAYDLGGAYKKKLYVKKIEGGKVYIDKTKYTQEEIDYIRKGFKYLVNMNLSNVDKMFTNDSDLGFDSGVDSDYDWGDEDITVIDDEEILDCENCLTKIQTKSYDENVNDENVKDFRWWINQDSNRLKSVTDKLKECCETKSDPTISTSYNKKNEWTLVAFSVVGNEWINSGKPKRTFEILDIDETNLIKPSSNYGDSRDYGWRDPIPSLCNEGKTMYCTKHWHGGEDYPYPTGTEIYVFQPGEVIEKGDWTLKIKHDDGSKTRYVHCDEFFVEKGDRIESGTLIGTVGNKGPTTGSHLHFEYWKPNENKTSNPKDIEDNYIRFKL